MSYAFAFAADNDFLELIQKTNDFGEICEQLSKLFENNVELTDYRLCDISLMIHYDEDVEDFFWDFLSLERVVYVIAGIISGLKCEGIIPEKIDFVFGVQKKFTHEKTFSIDNIDSAAEGVRELFDSLTADMIIESFFIETSPGGILDNDGFVRYSELQNFIETRLAELVYIRQEESDSIGEEIRIKLYGYRLNSEDFLII